MKHSYLQFKRSAFLGLIILGYSIVAQGQVTNYGVGSGTGGPSGSYFGSNAGQSVTTGDNNTFFGGNAGMSTTSGVQNVFIGPGTGSGTTTGNKNVYIGPSSNWQNTTGSYNVGLGYRAGYSSLSASGNVFLGSKAGYYETGSNKLYISNSETDKPLIFGEFLNKQVVMNGKVGISTSTFPTTIGTTNIDSYQLFVKGGILTDEIRVRTGWADYVFDPAYELKTLSQVESYIKENGHLPNMISASEVQENGIELGNIIKTQQEKIEELTLYLIEQHKILKVQQNEMAELKSLLKGVLDKQIK